jgi:hypothetical protein
VSEYVEPAAELVEPVRRICLALPDTHEEPAWPGVRWRIRQRTFAHVLGIHPEAPPILARSGGDATEPITILAFRADGEELHALRHTGPPFIDVGWGRDAIGMSLDAATAWDEVTELLTDSYCLLAPKKLAAQVARPGAADPQHDRR